MFRFLLFKFLPRRILPLLMLYEAIRLVMRMRSPDRMTRDDRVVDGRATVVPASQERLR